MKPRKKIALASLVAALALVVLVPLALRGLAAFMSVADPLVAGALVAPFADPAEAARLYREGLGSALVVWRTEPGRLERLGLMPTRDEHWRALLEREGVPQDAIVSIERAVESDEDLGRALRTLLSSSEADAVTAVVSEPWSRYVRRELRRGLGDAATLLSVHPVPPRSFDNARWWRSEAGLLTYVDVYVLWVLHTFDG